MPTNFRELIDDAYREDLGRAGDESGIEHYNAAMNAGKTEAQMRADLSGSDEGIAYAVNRAYAEILERPADAAGFADYVAAMKAGTMTEAAVRESMLRSAEYAAKNPDTPPPIPSTMTPLRVVGNKFHDGAGLKKLLGYIVCCNDENTPEVDEALELGWPLVNVKALDQMKAHLLNYTDCRLGPSIDNTVFKDGNGLPIGERPGMDGYLLVGDGAARKYDLDQWNPVFWERVRKVCSDSEARGVYVCFSIDDSWVLHHEHGPFTAARNIQGYEGGSLAVVKHAPDARHEAWIRKVVRETCAFPNVLYLDGNESFKGQPSLDWLHGIRDIARDEMGLSVRPFGSNSDRTDAVDFLVSHHGTVPPVGSIPHLDTEYQPSPTIARILSNAKEAWDTGSASFHYWAGEHSNAERAEVLAGLKAIVEGGGDIDPVPPKCPTLVKMGAKVHTIVTGGQQVQIPSVGSNILFDVTPRFSHNPNDPNGKPCNDEHNAVCGGRECECPQGGVWSIVSGNAQVLSVDKPFHFRIRLLDDQPVRVRCEPPDPYLDGEEGKPVQVGPNCPREVTVQAGVKPAAEEA